MSHKQSVGKLLAFVFVWVFFGVTGCGGSNSDPLESPTLVNILGYNGDAMEPFIDRTGNWLIFNSLNDSHDTSLYYAEKVDEDTFQYKGKIGNVNNNPPHLDAVGSMDLNNNFYFISTRNYNPPTDYKTVYKGSFVNGAVSDLSPVEGDFFIQQPGRLVMDAEVSPDGNRLYFVNALFPGPSQADIGFATYDNGRFTVDANSTAIMQNINTGTNLEYAPSITGDELELYFTRYNLTKASPEIYVAKRNNKTENFGVPVLIKLDGFVEAPSISFDKRTLYFHKKVKGIYRIYKIVRQ